MPVLPTHHLSCHTKLRPGHHETLIPHEQRHSAYTPIIPDSNVPLDEVAMQYARNHRLHLHRPTECARLVDQKARRIAKAPVYGFDPEAEELQSAPFPHEPHFDTACDEVEMHGKGLIDDRGHLLRQPIPDVLIKKGEGRDPREVNQRLTPRRGRRRERSRSRDRRSHTRRHVSISERVEETFVPLNEQRFYDLPLVPSGSVDGKGRKDREHPMDEIALAYSRRPSKGVEFEWALTPGDSLRQQRLHPTMPAMDELGQREKLPSSSKTKKPARAVREGGVKTRRRRATRVLPSTSCVVRRRTSRSCATMRVRTAASTF